MNHESKIKNIGRKGNKKCFMFYDLCSVKAGFTLVEMIVSVAIFSIVMVFSVGALLSVVAVNKQAQAMKSIVNNLNYALESMVRNIRTGSEYVGDYPGTFITFNDQKGYGVTYILENNQIMREMVDKDGNFISKTELTAPEVLIDKLDFYVDNTGQPKVIILIRGKMMVKSERFVTFDVETMATQRLFNK